MIIPTTAHVGMWCIRSNYSYTAVPGATSTLFYLNIRVLYIYRQRQRYFTVLLHLKFVVCSASVITWSTAHTPHPHPTPHTPIPHTPSLPTSPPPHSTPTPDIFGGVFLWLLWHPTASYVLTSVCAVRRYAAAVRCISNPLNRTV